jgi:hypothetical protein
LGFFEKIKTWFRKLTAREPKAREVILDQPVKIEVDRLLGEHTALASEYEQIRLRLVEIDDKLSMGEMGATEHDREYRQQLARAGQIRLQQMEIRAELSELGNPIPEPDH